MTYQRIINFDTIYSTKTDSNPFNTTFQLSENIRNITKITLKSIEIPISSHNLRLPYTTISVKYNNLFLNYVLGNKTYIDISSFLLDLNTLISAMQTYMAIGEICPVFSVSSTEINKLVMKCTLLSSSSLYIYSTGLVSYYLGGISLTPNTKTLVSGLLYLNTFNLLNVYNLCFDTYYNMIISNLDNQTSNNNNYPCHFKLIINSINNSIYFSGESNSYIQYLELHNKTLSTLNIEIRDRYNNVIVNAIDYSFTLEFEYN